MTQDVQPNRRGKPQRRLLAAGIILSVVALLGYVAWYGFMGHVFDPGSVTTGADVAAYTSMQTPPEAHDFRVAAFEGGQARLTFVRFLAPVEVCRKYAAALAHDAPLKPLSPDLEEQDVSMIHAGSGRFADLRWFDLPYANPCWDMQSGKPVFRYPTMALPDSPQILGAEVDTEKQGYLVTSVRVDVEHGVLYYLQAN